MAYPIRIALVGYRGCGKTTLGRQLAAELAYDFVDTDLLIEQRAGKSIAEIFAQDGEPAFRLLEEQVIADQLDRERTVLALGGGAIISPLTRERLNSACLTVWLVAPAEVLADRIATDAASVENRPSLTGAAPASSLVEVETVLRERLAWYAGVADVRLDVSSAEPSELVVQLVRLLSSSDEL